MAKELKDIVDTLTIKTEDYTSLLMVYYEAVNMLDEEQSEYGFNASKERLKKYIKEVKR